MEALRQPNSEPPEFHPQGDTTLGYIFEEPRLVSHGLTHEGMQQYLSEVIYPALIDAREFHNQQRSRKTSQETIERVIGSRFQEISAYAAGSSFASIAVETGVQEHTVRTNFFRTLKSLQDVGGKYNPEMLKAEFTKRFPEVAFSSKPYYEDTRTRTRKRPPKVVRQATPLPVKPTRVRQEIARPAPQEPEPTAQNDEPETIDYLDLPGDLPDSVKLYLKAIGRVPLLTAEDEVELSKRIEAGKMAECILGIIERHGLANKKTDD